MERVFPMPDLGEGLEEGRIVEWLVDVGDEVTLNQPLVEIETAKAAVEIPSPLAGSIGALHGRAGEDVSVGAPLITFEVARQPVEAARATPPVRKLAKELGLDIDAVNGTGRDGRITEADVERSRSITSSGLASNRSAPFGKRSQPR
jgi:pyruvate dehydrogenase E2 component (dihydrolipoamide acetyltransferase)